MDPSGHMSDTPDRCPAPSGAWVTMARTQQCASRVDSAETPHAPGPIRSRPIAPLRSVSELSYRRLDRVSQRCGHNHLAMEGLVDRTAVSDLD
jgi:hypothetical protein